MEVIEFEASVVARDGDGLVIALFDGSEKSQCVAILKCSNEAATAACEQVGSLVDTGAT